MITCSNVGKKYDILWNPNSYKIYLNLVDQFLFNIK
jgi:hypothetical protein